MDTRIFFRAIIPGYALVIPLFFYLVHLPSFDTHIISAIISAMASGFPIGIFLEFIVHTINHLQPWGPGHFVIRRRIRATVDALGINHPVSFRNIFHWNVNNQDNIQEHELRGFLNFFLHSHKKFRLHLDRHSFLASRTHSLLESILGIYLGNLSGILVLKFIKVICVLQVFVFHKDLIWVSFISLGLMFILWLFYNICKNDLLAYERLLINIYNEEIKRAWLSRFIIR